MVARPVWVEAGRTATVMLDSRDKVKDDELKMSRNTRGQLKVVLFSPPWA
jgi:hypothetical protein